MRPAVAQPFPLVPFWVVVHVCCSVLNVDPVEGIRSCVHNPEAVIVHEKSSAPVVPALPSEPVPPSGTEPPDELQPLSEISEIVRNNEICRTYIFPISQVMARLEG
jgi:hypothetical protein